MSRLDEVKNNIANLEATDYQRGLEDGKSATNEMYFTKGHDAGAKDASRFCYDKAFNKGRDEGFIENEKANKIELDAAYERGKEEVSERYQFCLAQGRGLIEESGFNRGYFKGEKEGMKVKPSEDAVYKQGHEDGWKSGINELRKRMIKHCSDSCNEFVTTLEYSGHK